MAHNEILNLFKMMRDARPIGTMGLFDIIKHKYTRREGTPGNYTYYYDEPGGGRSGGGQPDEEGQPQRASAEDEGSQSTGSADEATPQPQAGQQEQPQQAAQPAGGEQEALKATLGEEINGRPFEEQYAIAQEFLSKHTDRLAPMMDELNALATEGSVVQGRVKTVESALGKLTRKPDMYKTAEDLWDGTGLRITSNTIEEVHENVRRMQEKYNVVEVVDYVTNPNGGYRSVHLAVEDGGLMKEVQIRTKNQDTWANWCHDVYKPLNAEQEAAMAQSGELIQSYAAQMSEYFYAVDMNSTPPPIPDCPPVVAGTFGCLP